MAVSLAAPTRPEAVRISGGCRGLIYLFLRLKNMVPTYVFIIGPFSSVSSATILLPNIKNVVKF